MHVSPVISASFCGYIITSCKPCQVLFSAIFVQCQVLEAAVFCYYILTFYVHTIEELPKMWWNLSRLQRRLLSGHWMTFRNAGNQPRGFLRRLN